MLVSLSIHNILLIEKLQINFDRGFSVFTGETGAGKSIMLDALSLLLGARSNVGYLRPGEASGQVSAVFDVPASHPAQQLLQEHGFEPSCTILIRRILTQDGRNSIFVNDEPASLSFLKRLGQLLVEIHGQHAERAFLTNDSHRAFLDAYGGHEAALRSVGQCYAAWQEAQKSFESFQEAVERNAREVEFLSAAIKELRQLDPQQGEEESLTARRSDMQRAEKIYSLIEEVEKNLDGTQSPTAVVADMVRILTRRSKDFPQLVDPIVKAFDQVLLYLEEAEQEVKNAKEALTFDPNELENIEERLFSLRAAGRKFSVGIEELPALAQQMEKDFSFLENVEQQRAKWEKEVAISRAAYDKEAAQLSLLRQASAQELQKSVQQHLPSLKLEHAKFIIEIGSDSEQRTAHGIDKVAYLVETNAGMQAGPLLKIASGGELSRFLLAFRVALADRGAAPTLVFDEIDTGVGGAVASSIGAKLSALGEGLQVLSVTHAPQVAAKASAHFLVTKKQHGATNKMVTQLHKLENHERIEELARMLSGDQITEQARAAAKQLLIS